MPSFVFAAGSTSVTRAHKGYGKAGNEKTVEIVTVSFTADASDASVPDTSIELKGYVLKVITNPGSTAPTDNYDIDLGDPADAALDALAGGLANRDTANTEQAFPVLTNGVVPVFLSGTYTLGVSNNAVNSATGDIIFYLVDSL